MKLKTHKPHIEDITMESNTNENEMNVRQNDSFKPLVAIECIEVKKVKAEMTEKENTIEDIVCSRKLCGRYHITFLFLMSFFLMMTSGFSQHYIFSAEDVDYRCKYQECEHIELFKLGQNSTLDYKCLKYELLDDNGTCTEDNFDASNFTDCSEWVYEKPNSFVADFDLGCKEWKSSLLGTMHNAGTMIGMLIIGPLSDKFGRKKILIFSTLYTGVIGVLKSMIKIYWIVIALETVEPVLGENYSTAYTLSAEMLTMKSRPVIVIIFAISDALSFIFMALRAYLISNWRIFLISLYAPVFIFFTYIFFLDESPRWLSIKGRKDEAIKILRKAAKINKIVIDESKFTNFQIDQQGEENTNVNFREALKVTFSSKALIIRLLLCFIMWFTAMFNTYVLTINSVSLKGNKYINYVLMTLAGLTAGIILLLALTRFKRKGPLIFALTLTGVFCVSQSFVPKGYRWLSMLLYICGKINSSFTFKMMYLYTTELFPTYTRNTMLALCSAVGSIGSILAPLTPLLNDEVKSTESQGSVSLDFFELEVYLETSNSLLFTSSVIMAIATVPKYRILNETKPQLVYWSGLPSFLVGVLSLVTASIVTLMPDTSKDALPDNVKQAEAIGSKEKEKI